MCGSPTHAFVAWIWLGDVLVLLLNVCASNVFVLL